MSDQHLGYSTVIFTRNDGHGQQILLQKKDRGYPNGPDNWQVFGGRIETGETPTETVLREITEELCISVDEDQLGEPITQNLDREDGQSFSIHYHVVEATFDLKDLRLDEGCGVAFWYVDELENIKTQPHELEMFRKLIAERSW